MPNTRSTKAFSFIEVIISMLLISILAGMGLHAYVNVRDDVRKHTLKARLKQFNIAREQFIAEKGRVEAERIWGAGDYDTTARVWRPSNSLAANEWRDATNNDSIRRYHFLKRYIERPQFTQGNAIPKGTTIITPTNVHGTYRGEITFDANGKYGNAGTKISVTDN